MGSRLGYEYRYQFWVEDEIILRYKFSLSAGVKSFLFEIRTDFVVIRRRPAAEDEEELVDKEMIDSERFDACVEENKNEISLELLTRHRLTEYWMTEDEMQNLFHSAMEFAREKAADPRHASQRVIPVVLGLEVCTVQQEGELLGATFDRAIRAKHLVPLYLWPMGTAVERKPLETLLAKYLRNLSRIRVEDIDEGLSLVRMCGICGRPPTIGAQISLLHCNHAFHSHCVVRWLEDRTLCPLCDAQAHDYICRHARDSNMPLP